MIAWLLLAVGQRALGRSSVSQASQLKPREESRGVHAKAEKVGDGVRLKWISGKGELYEVQSSNDRAAWRKVGVVRKGAGGSDSVEVPKLPASVCGNNFYKRAASNYWRLFQKEIPNGSDFIGPRNHSRLPGRAPGLHRLDRPNRTTLRLIWLSEDRRMSGRKLFPGHKEGNGTK